MNREVVARAARRGMFRTSDRIDLGKLRADPVALADARTSMSDYRLALSLALGQPCDRNGFYVEPRYYFDPTKRRRFFSAS